MEGHRPCASRGGRPNGNIGARLRLPWQQRLGVGAAANGITSEVGAPTGGTASFVRRTVISTLAATAVVAVMDALPCHSCFGCYTAYAALRE